MVASIGTFLAATNWNIVAACAATIAALVAVITAWIIVWQTRYTLRIQTLNQLLASWQSPPMFPRMRQRAAQELLISLMNANIHHAATAVATAHGTPIDPKLRDTPHVDEVLDFFETVALFVKRDVLDFELAYHTFFWPMGCYWFLTQVYIRAAQESEGNELWKEYSALMPRFIEWKGERITIEHAQAFLDDEQSRAFEQ